MENSESKMKSGIDFVIIWVDGNDPAWQTERLKYKQGKGSDARIQRYRDWDNLKYWFRGVEKYANWVDKIHFVTWGHLPKWLNINHPKLNIVRHEDYIPSKFLPTFSSHVIELNLHRISKLSEQFVYFNDDMFLIKPTSPKDFFVKGKPCDSGVLTVHCYSDGMFVLAPFRNVGIINRYFDYKKTLYEKPFNWFNIKYGTKLIYNLVLLPCPRFPGFYQQHLPSSFLKSTFNKLWELIPSELEDTCSRRFRSIQDFNQWLFKDWQLAANNFYPRKISIGQSLNLEDPESVYKYITKQKGKLICINDDEMSNEQFEYLKDNVVNKAFEEILPEKSSFEL